MKHTEKQIEEALSIWGQDFEPAPWWKFWTRGKYTGPCMYTGLCQFFEERFDITRSQTMKVLRDECGYTSLIDYLDTPHSRGARVKALNRMLELKRKQNRTRRLKNKLLR